MLYDLYTSRDPSASRDDEEETYLPWNLILHFKSFPTKHLMRLDSPNACQDAWINCLKQACFARNGNAGAVMNLSKPESTKLWESLSTRMFTYILCVFWLTFKDDFERFWSVNEKVISESVGPQRSIPIRIYVPPTPRVIQRPISPYTGSSKLDVP